MSAPTPKEIRDSFRDYRNDWKEIREQGCDDMQAISIEGPWNQQDRANREAAGRPCIHLDQINQFVNQVIGNVRKAKRAVKAIPKGNGANDQDAKRRSSLIMGIEERSQAQPIYLYAFECMIQRSYGFAVLRTEYKDDSSFDQDIVIKPVMNPDTVLLSPHYKQPDASDVPEAFLLDRIPKSQFKSQWPKAKITDFSGEVMGEEHVSDWITDKHVQYGEFWKIEHDRSQLLLVETEQGPLIFSAEEWKKAKELVKGTVKRERTVETPRVMQYMTNGLEILDAIEWEGSRIPIIACLGPERWTTEGNDAKRSLLSMVRFARDPQMMYDYLASGEAEVVKKVPKVPFIGAKGQFESDQEAWAEATDVPHAYLQYDAITDATGQNLVPPPQFTQYVANFQEWEGAKDAAARSLQASMGITPLPDAALRRNQKSGVALDKIDDMESLGSFHFIDRYESNFLHNVGWQINELIEPIYDTEREMPMALPDGKRKLMQIVGSTSHPLAEDGSYEVQGLPEEHIHTGKGEFDVTISTGPTADSERDEQGQFVDQLIENLANLPQPGTPQAKVLAMGIRMRPTLGPIGKQIADIFDPPDPSNLPPQAQAAIQQMQAQLQALQQENQALHMDRAGRVLEQQTKVQLEKMKGDIAKFEKNVDYITRVVTAQLANKSKADTTQAQLDAQRELAELGFGHDQIDRAHDSAHEVAMAGLTHQNAMEQGQQAADAAAASNQADTQPQAE